MNYTPAVNDKRTVRCFKVRTRKPANPFGEVSFDRLRIEIDRGFEYFKAKRPHLHFGAFRFEFANHERRTGT